MDAKTWRKNEGYTLAGLSEKTGVAAGYISEVENGKKEPSFRLAKAYFDLSGGKVNMLATNAELQTAT